MSLSDLSPDARRARLNLLIRERHGAPLRARVEEELRERGLEIQASSRVSLQETDKLREAYSKAREGCATRGAEYVEVFHSLSDLGSYVRGLSHGKGDIRGWVLFCHPDVNALSLPMEVILVGATGLIEADRELIAVMDEKVTRGLVIDRIVHGDQETEYEVTIWGDGWSRNSPQ